MATAAAPSPTTTPFAGRKPYLLERLHLSNFMLHHETEVDCSRPITLITGPNGAGKTQILDALMLACGLKSHRIRTQGIASIVGPYGERMRIGLTLRNPRHPGTGRRQLTTGREKLDALIDRDRIAIAVEHTGGGKPPSLTYRLGAEDNLKRVSQAEVEFVLAQAGMRGRDPLAFTEGHVIDRFVSESPRAQFKTFLQTLGLLERYEQLLESRRRLQNCVERRGPLEQQYRLQRAAYERLRADEDAVRRRQEMQDTVDHLELSIAWAEADRAEREAEDQRAVVANVQQQLRDAETRLEQARRDTRETLARHSERQQQVREIEGRQRQRRDREAQLRANQEQATRTLGEYRDTLTTLRESEQEWRRRFDPAEVERLRAEAAGLQKEINAARDGLRDLERQRDEAKREADALGKKLGSGLAGRDADLTFLIACHRLRDLTAKQRVALQGPVVLEVNIAAGDPLTEAFPALLGPLATGFVAADAKAVAAVDALVATEWPEVPPPFSVGLPPATASATPNAPSGWTPLAARLSLPAPLAEYIDAHAPVLVPDAPDGDGVISLPDALALAMRAQRPVYRHASRQVVHPDGAVAWLDPQHATRARALRSTAEELRRTGELTRLLAAITEERDGYLARLQEMDATLATVTEPLREMEGPMEQARQVAAQIRDWESREQGVANNIADIQARLQRLLDEPDETEALRSLEAEIGTIRARLGHLEAEQSQAESDQQRASRRLPGHRERLNALANHADSERGAAEDLGDRPASLDAPDAPGVQEMRDRRIALQVELQRLSTVTIDPAKLEAQKDLVEDLHAQLCEADNHLQSLRKDIGERITDWRRELGEFEGRVNAVLQDLLGERFGEVGMAISRDPREGRGELSIHVRRRSDDGFTLAALSGGEKNLAVQGIICALHTFSDSPIHAIDEFTQRFSMDFKAEAFRMVIGAAEYARRVSSAPFAPQFVLLCPDTEGLSIASDLVTHIVVAEGRLGP